MICLIYIRIPIISRIGLTLISQAWLFFLQASSGLLILFCHLSATYKNLQSHSRSGQGLAVCHTATDKLQITTTCFSLGRRARVSPVRQFSSGDSQTIHPFPRCPKPARESMAVKTSSLLSVSILPQAENTIISKTCHTYHAI